MQGFFFMNIKNLYQIYLRHSVICTDSRKVVPGSIFFALKGDTFDGNLYAQKALESGAAYAIVDKPEVLAGEKYILVKNVLTCLQELAKFHRKQLNIPVLAITGSNGKTTTKELCRDVLQMKYKTMATSGNLNNHIGVPLTLLGTPLDVEILIVEMGANHQGEIDMLCRIANPSYVAITNIGKAHLEGFGGVEGIKKGKSEIYRYATSNHGYIFINIDDSVLNSLLPQSGQKIPYSVAELVKITREEPYLSFRYKGYEVKTTLYGTYNQSNIAFAIAVGQYFKVSDLDIIKAIENYIPDNNRSQIIHMGSNTYIMDAYNANPSSMSLSIQSFSKLEGENKLLILGDMLELGEHAAEEHEQIISLTKRLGFSQVIFIGKHFYNVRNKHHGIFFESVDYAKPYFKEMNLQNCFVLLKGSRGVAVEKILL